MALLYIQLNHSTSRCAKSSLAVSLVQEIGTFLCMTPFQVPKVREKHGGQKPLKASTYDLCSTGWRV